MADETNTAPVAAAAPASPEAAADKKAAKKNKNKKNILNGIVHIRSTFNNTMVTITDVSGNVISWSTAGCCCRTPCRCGTPSSSAAVP